MAAQRGNKKATDILLLTQERAENIPYLELEPDYRSNGGHSEQLVKDTIMQTKASIDAGEQQDIEGVAWIKTKASPSLPVLYIEVEDATPEILKDAQLWINDIVAQIVKQNPGSKISKADGRQAYTGTQIVWP